MLDARAREFNPRYAEGEGALLGEFRHLHTDIYGNRDFIEQLRNRGKFFDHEESRERDLILIDYDDPSRNPRPGGAAEGAAAQARLSGAVWY